VAHGADDLGLTQPITRRDFIGRAATSVLLASARAEPSEPVPPDARTGVALPGTSSAPPPPPYPPILTGLRGQYPGSFEVAHLARHGGFAGAITAEDTGEHYDLEVVGAGISGLAAAHLYRKALGADRRILLLDGKTGRPDPPVSCATKRGTSACEGD
jgi:spermidine dehydrogenase